MPNKACNNLLLLLYLNEKASLEIHCTTDPATKAISTLTKMAIIICNAFSLLQSIDKLSEES